jgi:Tol biopolymer transport system component
MNGRAAALAASFVLLCAGEPAARVIWNAPGANVLGAPTSDGKLITCVDPSSGDLAVLETATGKLRRLTEKGPAAAREYAYFSVPSRDGKLVAYAWFNDAGFYDLRVKRLDGAGQARVLFRNEESGFVQPTSWTPDGARILTLFFRKDNVSQIALVGAEDGSVRVLKSLNWVYPKKMEISPDGKWIVYDNFAGDKPGPRDIFLLAIDGSTERKLVDAPGEDLFPTWSPDGREVLFMSDRSGTMDAWAVSPAGGEPRLLRKGLAQALPMGVTARGDLYYGIRTGGTDIALLDSGVLPTRTPGRNLAPAFSRDGKRLAYLSRRGAENFGEQSRVIVIRDQQEEHDLVTRLAHIESVRWSPDGEWLLAAGSDGKGRSGLFQVRVKDGFVQPVTVDETAGYRGKPGAWKPDGGVVTGSVAIAISGDGKRTANALGDKVAVTGEGAREWPLDGVTWIEWAGDRLLVARAGKAYELAGSAARQQDWKDYDGGPFSVHPDGRTIAFGVGRTRHEVWVMERAFSPRVE